MTSKPETVLKQIERLENQEHSKIFLEFYHWLTDDQDSSPRNASTYLKILRMFSIGISPKKLDGVTKEDVVGFLNEKKKTQKLILKKSGKGLGMTI